MYVFIVFVLKFFPTFSKLVTFLEYFNRSYINTGRYLLVKKSGKRPEKLCTLLCAIKHQKLIT